MTVQSDTTLLASATQIGNETTPGANTATRVGSMLTNIIDSKTNRSPAGTDQSSMIDGDISSPLWTTHAGAAPSVSTVHVVPCAATTGSFIDACLVNPAGNATGTGSLEQEFILPTGVTACTIVAPIATVSGTSTVKIAILDSTRTEISSTIASVNATEASYSHAPTGLTANTLYYASIQVNNTAQQAAVYIGRVTCTPGAGGSGVFAAAFQRITVRPWMMEATNFGATWNAGRYFQQLGQSELAFETDTTTFVAEFEEETASAFQPAYFRDDRPFLIGASGITAGKPNHQATTAPAGRVIKIRNSVSGSTGSGPRWGNKLRAIYLPLTADFRVPAARGPRRMIVYGDSITDGGSTSSPLINGWVARVRNWFPGSVAVDAYSGRNFFTDANTLGLRAALTQLWTSWGPTDIWLAIGTNDFAGAFWTAANFGTAYADLLDKIHAASPATIIWAQNLLHRSNETGPGAPNTWADFNAAIATACSGRAWVVPVDATGATGPAAGMWPVAADTVDGTHPNTNGHGKYGEAAIIVLQAGGVL